VTWLNLAGTADTATVAAVGEAFGLHPLVLEDIVHAQQRPKVEVFGAHVFVVVQMVSPLPPADGDGAANGGWETEQVSFVLGPGLLLSFQPDATDVFDPVRERLRSTAGRVRARGADYLLYALLDLVVDSLFGILETVGDRIEDLEDAAVERPSSGVQVQIAVLRREMSMLRRSVWPLREVLAVLQREDTPHIHATTRPYLRDVYDHIVQVVDVIESLRDVLASTLDLYLSVLSTRQNEVMKVLTVLGTVFLPLTFLTGLYGMNFDHMPELHWRYGYPALLAVMAAVVTGALAYFRRRRWL
jgi:magnesium transporter